MMTCRITIITMREIKEKTKKASMPFEAVALERWATEGGFIENEEETDLPKAPLPEQKFRDDNWDQTGSDRKGVRSTSPKQYRPSLTDISRHNPHV